MPTRIRGLALRVGARQTQPETAHLEHRLGAIVHVEDTEHVLNVRAHGAVGQIELAADHLVGLALHEQRQDLRLTIREAEIFRLARGLPWTGFEALGGWLWCRRRARSTQRLFG